jgi:hypothetical protein
VTINLSTVENSITTDKRSEKNAALNKILDQVLSIVESNGDSVVSSFGIILDSSEPISLHSQAIPRNSVLLQMSMENEQ